MIVARATLARPALGRAAAVILAQPAWWPLWAVSLLGPVNGSVLGLVGLIWQRALGARP